MGVPVFLVKNGNYGLPYSQILYPCPNTKKLINLMGGINSFINATDIVVIKVNAQWPCHGGTNLCVVKTLVDIILEEVPGFNGPNGGEIFLSDNTQVVVPSQGQFLFDMTGSNRNNNWSLHNLNTLGASYSGNNRVTTLRWYNDASTTDITVEDSSDGWVRNYFDFYGYASYLSHPIFSSTKVAGRRIDMGSGVYESGVLTDRRLRVIFVPTLNTHTYAGYNTTDGYTDVSDYSGMTSAVKSFFGATELHTSGSGMWNSRYDMHGTTYQRNNDDPLHATRAGELTAKFINEEYAPILYITTGIYMGVTQRRDSTIPDGIVKADTLVGAFDPATSDWISSTRVLGPHAPWLDASIARDTSDLRRTTYNQIYGCVSSGIGTMDDNNIDLYEYDFLKGKKNRSFFVF